VRKGIANVFIFFLRADTARFASQYMPMHPALLYQLCDGYSSAEIVSLGLLVGSVFLIIARLGCRR
jgi:hypothetical protein